MTYLGQSDPAANGTDAESWLRSRWTEFLDFHRRILELQHEAAVTANEARERGDVEGAAAAVQVTKDLGKLVRLHAEVVERLEVLGFDEGSLGAFPLVPVAALGFSGLATVALWIFRRYEAEAEKLSMIREGILTPEQAAALDPPPPPGTLAAAMFGDVGRWLLLGMALYLFGLPLLERLGRRMAENPPLLLFENPPGRFGRQVYAVEYRHDDDGLDYRHDFGPRVRMDAEEDGSVRIYHSRRPVWAEFDV